MSLTYQTGVLAGSLVAGYLAGLTRPQLLDCLGIAYSQVAGNLQGLFEGTLTVRLQQGIAAQAAVMALEFARAGITGAREPLEGRAGWYPAFFGGHFDYSRDRLLHDLGMRFLGDEISIKPFACCKYGHNVITAVLILRNDPDLSVRSVQEATRTPGHPEYPLDGPALRAKFLCCTRRLGPARSQDLLDAVAHLDELDDVAQIARLTVPS
jgi:2-methylcitrate dehydratase PrpD